MSTGRAKLAQAVRAQAAACDDLTTSELLKVLARLVEGNGIYRSFGRYATREDARRGAARMGFHINMKGE